MTREVTRHGAARMQQRGISARDIDLIMEYGTAERPGLHRLRNRDADREIRECKLRIQTLERLRGCAAVVEKRHPRDLLPRARCPRQEGSAWWRPLQGVASGAEAVTRTRIRLLGLRGRSCTNLHDLPVVLAMPLVPATYSQRRIHGPTSFYW